MPEFSKCSCIAQCMVDLSIIIPLFTGQGMELLYHMSSTKYSYGVIRRTKLQRNTLL